MAESNSQPVICPCGFFGSAQTLGLCSKCYKESGELRDQRNICSTSDLRSHTNTNSNNYNNTNNNIFNNNNDNYSNDVINNNCNNSRSTDEDDDEDEDYNENMENTDLNSSSSLPSSSSSSSSLPRPVSSIPSSTHLSYAMIPILTDDDENGDEGNKNSNNTPSSNLSSSSSPPPLSFSPSSPPKILPTIPPSHPSLPLNNSTATTTTHASTTSTNAEPTTNSPATTTTTQTPIHTTTNTTAIEQTDAIEGTTKDSTIQNNILLPTPPTIRDIKSPKNRLGFPRPHSDSMITRNLKRKHTEAFSADDMATTSSGEGMPNKYRKKCYVCNARLHLALQTIGRCKCEFSFCSLHRLPEQHQCTFDHKESSRNEARAKMVVFKKHVGTALKRLDNDF